MLLFVPLTILLGAVVVVIVWWLNLQLPVQSVPITTQVVSSNPVHDEVYSMQHYVIKFVGACGRPVVFPGYSGFLHNKVHRHDN